MDTSSRRHTPAFKKGRSGNPGGRPRSEPLAAATIVAEELQATVFVMENGQRLKASKFRLLIKQTINQAIKGNVRALKIFLEILDKLERLNKTPTKMHPRVRIDLSKLSLEEKQKMMKEILANTKSLDQY